ncbi:hypothetical protein [Kyrpidia sp.]|uniref:hypothetical protein n=1 Tax=Kyrpidia sp. TaxID=2073077 RepID=UPI00258FB8EF|nr:hypothetical protein [Kyrpidia sp.]MCL6577539.1 hypothetical protein [Kyrpidia sp.]
MSDDLRTYLDELNRWEAFFEEVEDIQIVDEIPQDDENWILSIAMFEDEGIDICPDCQNPYPQTTGCETCALSSLMAELDTLWPFREDICCIPLEDQDEDFFILPPPEEM